MSKKIERYLVKQAIHVGPISHKLNANDVLSWNSSTKQLTINGTLLPDRAPPFCPEEAIRQLKALELVEKLPDVPRQTDNTKPKTKTLCMLPVLGCLAAARDFIGKIGLVPTTKIQKEFIALYSEKMPDTDSIPELERIADTSIVPINRWLKSKGFDIQLRDNGPDGIAVASVLNVLERWIEKGTETEIRNDRGVFPAVSMGKNVEVTYDPRIHQHPVVRITARNGDVVCMSMVDTVPTGTFGIHREVLKLQTVTTRSQWGGVKFPMVDYRRVEDIDWLVGMTFSGEWFIDQAIQQTEFRMNEDGARVKSAAAMEILMCASGPLYTVIDKPFLLWIERKSISQPLFAAVLVEDVWKRPKCL